MSDNQTMQDSALIIGDAGAGEPPRVSLSVIGIYSLPAIGFGYVYMVFTLYFLKFSTDVLLIAPAVIGAIFGLARLIDVVSDPLIGYLSDRTGHAMGRRRPWMLAGAIPFSAAFLMTFSPPGGLTGWVLVCWIAVSVIVFYVCMSAFAIPHMSLGAELTENYHDRSRTFGARYVALTLGYILGLAGMAALISAEARGIGAAREMALSLGLLAAVLTSAAIIFSALKLREPGNRRQRGAKHLFQAYRDVFGNRHARPVLIATLADNLGSSATGVMVFYVAEYVLGVPDYGPIVLIVWLFFSLLSVPLWVRLARRFGKRNLWIFAMVLGGLAYGSLFAVAQATIEHFLVVAALTGAAAGCGGTISPSLQGDVVDYDEYLTGERKEGSYYAVWNFVVKAAGGITVMLVGFVLQWSGFVPRAEQSDFVKTAMMAMLGLFPLACYLLGAFALMRFSLNEREHGEIRSSLDQRAKVGDAGTGA